MVGVGTFSIGVGTGVGGSYEALLYQRTHPAPNKLPEVEKIR